MIIDIAVNYFKKNYMIYPLGIPCYIDDTYGHGTKYIKLLNMDEGDIANIISRDLGVDIDMGYEVATKIMVPDDYIEKKVMDMFDKFDTYKEDNILNDLPIGIQNSVAGTSLDFDGKMKDFYKKYKKNEF